LCREAFDLHLFSYSPLAPDGTDWSYQVWVACLDPESFGSVTLASADPQVAPRVDHGFLSDPDGHDLAVLQDGLELARDITSRGALGQTIRFDDDDIRRQVGIYFHPACSCRMGPARDPLAVVDTTGAVHGLDGLNVCDASIFPRLMRANTNLPAAMLAEHLAPKICV
jgi:choline dehydrogenase